MPALTVTCPGIANKLRCEVVVKDPAAANGRIFMALWDTGATNCVVTKKVAESLGLVETGKTEVYGVNGPAVVSYYVVDIVLPSGIKATKIVTEGISRGDWDVLIGMDIMSLGDFCLSNHNGVTVFTFRIPSEGTTDYVAEANASRAIQGGG